MKTRARCAFCNNAANSKEHVFPKWLRPYVPVLVSNHHTSSLSFRISAAGPDFQIVNRGKLHRPGSPYSKRLRVVCETCNNEWMGQLQERAKPALVPFLRGEWPDIVPAQQKLLAAWATMTTMVIEFAHIDTMASTPKNRATLKDTLAPPENWFVFIGKYKNGGVWNNGVFNHFGINATPKLIIKDGKRTTPPPDPLHPLFPAQSTAFAIGTLFFLTFSSSEAVTFDIADFASRNGLVCLWPSEGKNIVAPKRELDDQSADILSRSFLPPDMRSSVRPAWVTI